MRWRDLEENNYWRTRNEELRGGGSEIIRKTLGGKPAVKRARFSFKVFFLPC